MESEKYMNRKSRKQSRAEVEVEVSICIITMHRNDAGGSISRYRGNTYPGVTFPYVFYWRSKTWDPPVCHADASSFLIPMGSN